MVLVLYKCWQTTFNHLREVIFTRKVSTNNSRTDGFILFQPSNLVGIEPQCNIRNMLLNYVYLPTILVQINMF